MSGALFSVSSVGPIDLAACLSSPRSGAALVGFLEFTCGCLLLLVGIALALAGLFVLVRIVEFFWEV